MTRSLLQTRLSLSIAVFALAALPGVCATITVSSTLAPNPLLLPDQTLAYLGNNNQAVPVGPGTFTLGAFQSTVTTNPTPTPAFALTLTDSIDATPLIFAGSFASVGGNDTLSFTGTGTETINGVTFATIADAGYIYGVQQSTTVNLGKGTAVISSIVASVPEPAACFLCGLGLLALAGIRRKHS